MRLADGGVDLVRWSGEPATHCAYPGLEGVGVRHGFTTRHLGNPGTSGAPGGPFGMGIADPVLRALGVEAASVRVLRQVHGTEWVIADAGASGLVGTGDALITAERGLPLAIFTADCLAVVLADPQLPILAVAHAGWRGTVGGILVQLVATLRSRFGARPDRLRVAIGPSIGPCCYEVDEPVVGPLREAFPADWERWTRPAGRGKWWLDLWRANRDQLAAAGVPPEAILNARLCTGCRRDLFFSYRKEGAGVRMAAVAVMGQIPWQAIEAEARIQGHR